MPASQFRRHEPIFLGMSRAPASLGDAVRRQRMPDFRKMSVLPSWTDLRATIAKSRGALITLAACLVLAVVAIYFATTIYSDLPLTGAGLIAMVAGVVVTL